MGGGGSAQQSQKHPETRESIMEWVQISMASQRKAQLSLQESEPDLKGKRFGGSEIWVTPKCLSKMRDDWGGQPP